MPSIDLGHIDQSELCGACGEFRGKHWGEAKDYCRGVASRFAPTKAARKTVDLSPAMIRVCQEALSAYAAGAIAVVVAVLRSRR